MNDSTSSSEFLRDGFLSPVDIIDAQTAESHRRRLEQAESEFGPIHYKPKIYSLLTSPFELATQKNALDVVEGILGPDILLYNITYIIKEPHTPSHVSWHQDLTYWGFDSDDQVTMWLALSPATVLSGCMMMIPGSHISGAKQHHITDDPSNVLYSGQTVNEVNEWLAVACQLQPGQASFHHGWTLHSSMPNESDDRRIGLNVQFIAPHLRQTKHDADSAILVRGEDRFHHFEQDIVATSDLTEEGKVNLAFYEERYKKIASGK
jgi:hypothetical protein